MSCKYKNILGVPGKGTHARRFFGFAFWDIFLTIIASVIIAWLTKKSFVIILPSLFLIGVFLQWLFCVDTTFMKLLKGA